MKTNKALATLSMIALGIGAIYYVRKIMSANPADVSGVTETTKSGPTGALTTTPIKLGNVAYVAANTTLDTLAAIPARVAGILSSFIPARTNAMQPQGGKMAFAAALYTNRDQTAANYNPSYYAYPNQFNS